MGTEDYPSELLAKAVEQFKSLPGIGERTALRLVLHVLKQDKANAVGFGNSIINLVENVQFCNKCHNISDTETCGICSSKRRDAQQVCVVENVKDVMAIEKTQQYNGLYHVLGGIISPMDGIGPNDINIDSLVNRVKENDIREVILAISPTMEGETTNFYIDKKLKSFNLKISIIARGVAFGNELEYTDELTLGRSIQNRIPFQK